MMINLTTFKPQLVGEGNPDSFIYHNEAVFVEPKIDGIRILCQKEGDKVTLYSRTGKDWTQRFGKFSRKLASYIKADTCVLDGELAVLKGKRILSSCDVLRKDLRKGERYCYFVFDVLSIQGEVLLEETLLSRKQQLGLVVEESKTLQCVPFFPTNSMADVQDFFRKCVKKGFEGIVLKNCKQYFPNSRYNWLKLKPFKTIDLRVEGRTQRKDSKGWIYSLTENCKVVSTVTSKRDLPDGTIVEVGYEKKFEHGESFKLRFPKLIRIREDK